MKKPISIYFVALWTFFQKTFYANLPVEMIAYRIFGYPSPLPTQFMAVISLAVLVLMIALVQLRPLARIAVIVLLGVAVFFTAIIFANVLATMPSPSNGQQFSTKTYISFSVMLIIDVLCIVYLARPRFGTFCKIYRAEISARKRERVQDKENQRILKQIAKI